MIKRIPGMAGLLAPVAAMAFLHAVPAAAEQVNFCASSNQHCVDAFAKNEAFATVTSVEIRQLAENGCAAVTKKSKKNMPRNTAIKVAITDECSYHFKFNTTQGCIGTKDNKLTPEDSEAGKLAVTLQGGCGTLAVKLSSNTQSEE